MDVDLVIRIVFFLAMGYVAGLLAGLFGIGGGFPYAPIFVYAFPRMGVARPVWMQVAAGTSMALIIPTAIAASIKQYRPGNLDLRFHRTWAPGILAGVIFGPWLVPYVSSEIFQVIFIFHAQG